MKVLVTGGAGFIGSHVVDKLLSLKCEVVVLDNFSTGRRENIEHLRNSINVVKCDISKRGKWEELFQGVGWVFHIAALADIVPSIENPRDYYASNVDGTFNVLEACRRHDVQKVVYAASSSCYGIPETFPTKETAEIKPEYPYALTKNIGEQLVAHWNNVYGIPSVSLRFFNVYGPRSRTSGTYGAVFGVFLAQKLAGQPFTVVGDGTQTRDFTYVTDVASAVVASAQQDTNGEVFNIGSDGTYSINKLVELLGGEVEYIPKRPGEPDCTWANIDKAKNLLNWRPLVSFEEGVSTVLKNIEYWEDAPLWDKESIAEATSTWFRYLT